MSNARTRLQKWLDLEDATHFGEHEYDVAALIEFFTILKKERNKMRKALQWIVTIADMNYECDTNLNSRSARTLLRISNKASEALKHES